MVGIFWLLPDLSDLFYSEQIDIAFAQKYEHWLISEENHSEIWEKLKRQNYLQHLPKVYREDYWKLPRGRVSYNILRGTYYVYHGNRFLKKNAKIIEKRFELSTGGIVYEEDFHYCI